MSRLRLRTQLLISGLLIICGLTWTIVLVIRHTLRSEITQQMRVSTDASIRAFESVQHQREQQLARSAAMLASLPTLKALMTTEHAPTIQDASEAFWRLGGSDLFLLADSDGRLLGMHVRRPGFDKDQAEIDLKRSLDQGEDAAWWYANGQLYQVFLHSIQAGSGSDSQQLGVVALGYQVDTAVAEQLAAVAESQVALTTGTNVIASTLSLGEQAELQTWMAADKFRSALPRELTLNGNEYEAGSVFIHRAPGTPVQCYVLMSLEPVSHFIRQLNTTISAVGISAVILAALLLSIFSRTITRPLDNLVSGVRALATGNYTYSIKPSGSSEVAELGEAFATMRSELLESQRRWAAAERVSALGRAASSISHDLRHSLAAVVANAEFLYDAEKLKLDRDEIYHEIKIASEQMTDLLDSLRELAREDSSISSSPAFMDQAVRRAIDAVLTRPELRNRNIAVSTTGDMEGVFDAKKIERAFFNLVLNACESTVPGQGQIRIDIHSTAEAFEIRVTDNGTGIPDTIRATLFDPFISSGKPSGTGLGLAIVKKIIHDHDGTVEIERTSDSGTVFLIKFPRFSRTLTPSENPVMQ
ncbi:MAG TPA: HAMP domain-containing sensor histidine kinase [Candidatus Acidoferrales bacterium]